MIRRIFFTALREISTSAASPAAWAFLIIFLALSSFCAFSTGGLFATGQADLSPFFDWMPWLFLLIVPALAMPMWAEERRIGAFELTLSFPSGLFEIAAGKFLAGVTLLAAALVFTFSIPVTALVLGKPDLSAILCGYAGALLLGSVYFSISLFCSAVTRSQTASFLVSIFICGIFLLCGYPGFLELAGTVLPEFLVTGIASCGIFTNYKAFQKGIFDLSELVYCLSLTGMFLALSVLVLHCVSSVSAKAKGKLMVGIFPIVLIAVSLNIIAGTFNIRFDVSEDQAYSISPTSCRLSSALERPVTLRLYASVSHPAMPVYLKKYAGRVKWLLEEFAHASQGKLHFVFIDVEQDSRDEEAALLDGIRPLNLNGGDRVFLGVSATYADQVASAPFLSPDHEKMLEYEICRIALKASRSSFKMVGVISPFQVAGTKPDPNFSRRTRADIRLERAWYSIGELQKDFMVVPLPYLTAKIPEDISALLVIHPVNLPKTTRFAMDQYLMRGGKMAVFLDSRSFYAALKTRQDYSMLEKLESQIPELTSAWGVSFNVNLMAADMNFAYRKQLPDRMITNPMVLNLTPSAISRTNPATAALNAVTMYFSGFFLTTPKEGLRYETLLSTSKNSQIVSTMVGERPELVIRNFKPSGSELVLGLRIDGTFPSAFSEPPVKGMKHLRKSEKNPEVYLFSDSDMLFNDVCVSPVRDALGQKSWVRSNDNVTMLQNIMENLTDSPMLADVRGRIPMSRPLTKINEVKAAAELKYKNRILSLEREFRTAQSRLNYFKQLEKKDGTLSAEARAEIRSFTAKNNAVKRELKELRSSLRTDLNKLELTMKIINIVLVPVAVGVLGLLWAFLRMMKGRARS